MAPKEFMSSRNLEKYVHLEQAANLLTYCMLHLRASACYVISKIELLQQEAKYFCQNWHIRKHHPVCGSDDERAVL